MAAWRRERRVLQRISRAAWRLEQAERERDGVPAVVIRHGLLVAALGVPDGHLVVPWVPGGGAGR
jgi:hypothetical protein